MIKYIIKFTIWLGVTILIQWVAQSFVLKHHLHSTWYDHYIIGYIAGAISMVMYQLIVRENWSND